MSKKPRAKQREPVAFTVLGGYLGAGKTTLLNRLLADNQGLRIALLINDFGAINIDADLIEKRTDQQINLTNGCVCCGLADGFDEAIEQLAKADRPPDHIIVEASGVADVHSLAQYGKSPGLSLNAVVVVADATSVQQKYNDKYVAGTVRRQLQAADLLLLNKIDLVSAERAHDLRLWLGGVNACASLVETRFCKLPLALLLDAHSDRPGEIKETTSVLSDTSSAHAHHHETYVTWNFTSNERMSKAKAELMLLEFPANLLRGKGFIATDTGRLEWHKVGRYERLTETHLPSANTTTLVAIGLKNHLPIDELTAAAERYLKPAEF